MPKQKEFFNDTSNIFLVYNFYVSYNFDEVIRVENSVGQLLPLIEMSV